MHILSGFANRHQKEKKKTKTFILIQPGSVVTWSLSLDSLPPFWSWCNRRVDRSLCRCLRLIDRINGDQTDLSADMSYCKQEGMPELTRTVTLNPFNAHHSLSFSGAANAHALKSHSHQPCLVISVSYLNIYELQIVFSNVSCFIILYCMCLVSLMMNYWFIG